MSKLGAIGGNLVNPNGILREPTEASIRAMRAQWVNDS